MKRSFIICFCFILNIASNDAIGQELIAHYPCDNSALDISKNKNNGIMIGGVTAVADRFGNPCSALKFNGINGFIEVPNSPSLESPVYAFSATGWFKIEDVPLLRGLNWLTLICKGSKTPETPENPQYRVQTFQSRLQSTISINTDFTEYDMDFHKHLFEFGKWHFYALVYDGQFVKAYLDSHKIWEFAYNKPLIQNSDPLHIAKDVPGGMEFFCGSLDDVRIFLSPLTEAQITRIYRDVPANPIEEEFSMICPGDIIAYTEKDGCYSVINYPEPELRINCGKASLSRISGLPQGSRFPVGVSQISFEATGSTGQKKTCDYKITVEDREPPLIICSNDIVLDIKDEGQNDIECVYPLATASDNCSAEVRLIKGIPSGGRFPVGASELVFEATDKSGNSARCNFNVLVNKGGVIAKMKEGPDSLECPPDIKKFNDSRKCGAVVNYTLKNKDNKLKSGEESGAFFPVGTTVNTFATPDMKECSFQVLVIDNEKPEIICPLDIIVYSDAATRGKNILYSEPAVTDNCGRAALLQINGEESGSLFAVGTTQNVFKATDIYGNYATCSFNVIVIDTLSKSLHDTLYITEFKPGLISDSIRYAKSAEDFQTCIITIVMYDIAQQDHDTISVFYNGKEIVSREELKIKKNGMIVRSLLLNAEERNEFIVKAWNMGEISPNTLKIEFYQGYYLYKKLRLRLKKPAIERIMNSKPGLAAGIYLRCKNLY
jgi:hypothetical protein